jgi:alpha-beta hydrolase superfamily lysophospholipase
METEPPILISRADQLNQLFYQQGNQQIRLFPIGEQQFLTPLGDLIRWQPTHIHITTGLTPEATAVNTGVPTKNYQEALISIPNGDIALSGSLYLPMGEGPFPVLILLHGSGAGERHFYRIFADLFARNGIATLIYDKRGHGRSTGESETATLQNLADDAHAGIQFLAQMDEIDAAQIGVWGFSQGGRILPMVLAQNEDAAFAIAVSAPAMSVNRLNLWRTDKEQQAAGKSELARTFLLRINQFQQTLPWRDRNTDWEVEPTSFWQQVTQPILLVYGGKDNVVPPNDSAEAILTTLAQTGHQNSSLAFFPAANHDIMLTETAPSAALNAGVPTFAPDYFSTMITWIQAGQPTQTTQPTLLSTGEFTGNGRYAPAPWYTQFWFLSLLVLVMEIAGIYILHHHRKKTAANSPTFRNED